MFLITVITGKYFRHNPVLAGTQILFVFHTSGHTENTVPVVRNNVSRNGETLTKPLVAKKLVRAAYFHRRDGSKVHPTMSVEISQLTEIIYQERLACYT